jgi:hypothetical protein
MMHCQIAINRSTPENSYREPKTAPLIRTNGDTFLKDASTLSENGKLEKAGHKRHLAN